MGLNSVTLAARYNIIFEHPAELKEFTDNLTINFRPSCNKFVVFILFTRYIYTTCFGYI
jgi:hypothetical protein